MLQPMIPGPAFYSLTSLPSLHAAGMPPVSCCGQQTLTFRFFSSNCYVRCSTFTITTQITYTGRRPACPPTAATTKGRRRRRRRIWVTRTRSDAATSLVVMNKTNRKWNSIVRNSCRSGWSRPSRRRRNRWPTNRTVRKVWSAATSTRGWTETLRKNSSSTPWPSSSRRASKAEATPSATFFKKLFFFFG